MGVEHHLLRLAGIGPHEHRPRCAKPHSSAGQSLDIQIEALTEAGCEKLFSEKMSGRSAGDREQLGQAIDFVREVTR
nr:recombinase family protein [Novosphingobium sp. G106]